MSKTKKVVAKKVATKRPAPRKTAKKRVSISFKTLYGHMGEFVKRNAAKLNNHKAVEDLNVRIALVTEYLKFVQENS